MDCTFEKKKELLELKISGRLDTVTAGDLQKQVEGLMDDTVKEVAIDCSGLEYISSSGLRVLMTLYKRTAPKGGHVTLRKLTPQVGEVLDITGMATLFNLE